MVHRPLVDSARTVAVRDALQVLCLKSRESDLKEDGLRPYFRDSLVAAGHAAEEAPSNIRGPGGDVLKPDVKVASKYAKVLAALYVELKDRKFDVLKLQERGAFAKYDPFNIAVSDYKVLVWQGRIVEFARADKRGHLTLIEENVADFVALVDAAVQHGMLNIPVGLLAASGASWVERVASRVDAYVSNTPDGSSFKSALKSLQEVMRVEDKLFPTAVGECLFLVMVLAWVTNSKDATFKSASRASSAARFHHLFARNQVIASGVTLDDPLATEIEAEIDAFVVALKGKNPTSLVAEGGIERFLHTFLKYNESNPNDGWDWITPDPEELLRYQLQAAVELLGKPLQEVRVIDPCCGLGGSMVTFLRLLHEEQGDDGFRRLIATGNVLENVCGTERNYRNYVIGHIRVSVELIRLRVNLAAHIPIYRADVFEMLGAALVPTGAKLPAEVRKRLHEEDARLRETLSRRFDVVTMFPPPRGASQIKEDNGRRSYAYVQFFTDAAECLVAPDGVVSVVWPATWFDANGMANFRDHLSRKVKSARMLNLNGTRNSRTPPGHPGGRDEAVIRNFTGGTSVNLLQFGEGKGEFKRASEFGSRASKLAKLKGGLSSFAWATFPRDQTSWAAEDYDAEADFDVMLPVEAFFQCHGAGIVTCGNLERLHTTPDRHRIRVQTRAFDALYIDVPFVDNVTPGLAGEYVNEDADMVLVVSRGENVDANLWRNVVVSDLPAYTSNVVSAGGRSLIVPLYFRARSESFLFDDGGRTHNLSADGLRYLPTIFGLPVRDDSDGLVAGCSPEDFAYLVLGITHDPTYRKKFGVALRRTTPRVPLRIPPEAVRRYVTIGRRIAGLTRFSRWTSHPELRVLSLGEPTFPPGSEHEETTSPRLDGDQLYFTRSQCFAGVDATILETTIAGFKVLKKFWEDRAERNVVPTTADTLRFRQMYEVVKHLIDESAWNDLDPDRPWFK